MKLKAIIPTFLAASLQLLFGLVYIFRNEFMPYHAQAVGIEWEQVSESFQYLFIAGMKIAGVGFLMSSMMVAYLQIQFMKDFHKWIPNLILFIGTMSYIGSMSAILIVKFNTQGNPPYLLATAGWILIIVGYFFNRRFVKATEINV
ncbi:MAG: hypothetical protein JXR07_00540 [Reichenbachiella sp.]